MIDRVGQQLGNYRLTGLLGKGGFAEVYLGEHVYLETQAAIKVLLTQLASEDMEPFRLEAKRVAHLEHPHIVRVLEFGLDGTTPYLVMSYAPNGTLRQRHPKGVVLPPLTILGYVKQAADALQYAHDEHFIHRDVKPENLLIGRRQEILLSDFGIALLSQTSRSQSMQDVAGTASYMAPEQFQGMPRPASDQYALGIIVYEWLSGDRPFHGSFTEIASQHLFVPPPPLHKSLSDIPASVEQVVMTALAKDPKQRFGSIEAFATAFEQACQVEASQTLPANRPQLHTDAMPESRSSQSPMERVNLSDELAPQEELITPRSQSSTPPSQTAIPTYLSIPSSQATVLPEMVSPSSQAALAQTELVTPRNFAQSSSTEVAQRPKPFPVAPEELIPSKTPRRGLSRGRMILFIGLALLVVAGSLGLFNTFANHNSTNNVPATATAQIATYLAGKEATINAFFPSATAQAQVQAQATITALQAMYTHFTSGTPVLDDPLHDNSKGYQWDENAFCQFSGGAYHVTDACYAHNTNFSNFTFEVQMTHNATGTCGRIYFRTSYEFDDCNGCSLTLYPIDGPLGFSCNLNQPSNLITIVAKDNTVILYVNRQAIGMATDRNHTSSRGQIGLASRAGPSYFVVYTNAKVWTF